MWDWLNGEIELSNSKRKTIFTRIRNMELDCERRSVEIIKKFNLTIDLKMYICVANVYIYYYNYAMESRKWFPDKVGPSTMTKLHPLMPISMYGKRSDLPDNIREIMASYF